MLQEVIEHLADHQPSRSVVLCEQAGPRGIDAMVSTSCRMGGDHAGSALELVRLTLRGDTRGGAASATVPLLRSDLPTVLWWPSAPDLSPGGALGRLAEIADRVITESGRGPARGESVRALADWVPARRAGDHRPRLGRDHRLAPAHRADARGRRARGPALRRGGGHDHAYGARGPCADALLLAGWLREPRSAPGW